MHGELRLEAVDLAVDVDVDVQLDLERVIVVRPLEDVTVTLGIGVDRGVAVHVDGSHVLGNGEGSQCEECQQRLDQTHGIGGS